MFGCVWVLVLVVVLWWRFGRCGGVSAVWPVGISAFCRLDSRRVALPHLCTLGWGAGETRVK